MNLSSRLFILFQCLAGALCLIAAVEYFKYKTRISYEWFHCTPVMHTMQTNTSVQKIWAYGGPSCDKRGELKTIMKRITMDYDPNHEPYSFCIIENVNVAPIHYPIHENKGNPGYVSYVGYDRDSDIIAQYCNNATIMHL